MKKKIAVITATRAEYGLLSPLINKMMEDDFFDCQVLATGTHLLEKYGNTVKYIEADGVPIKYKVPIMEESSIEQNHVIAAAITKFAEIYACERYDAIVVLGDRYELYGFTIPAMLQNIPIIHIHGGEKTEGAVDEKIRHSITKMASIHFPSIPEYAKRIIQMGENPQYVYAVGALGIDNAMHLPLLSKAEVEERVGISFDQDVAIVTFHPVTLEDENEAERQIKDVMEALVELPIFSVITMPNSDMGGDTVLNVILDYVSRYPDKMKFVKSLGQLGYLSCLKYAALVLGNSSSGIIETASFQRPTIDIGDRQQGRFAPRNVIHCECSKNDIVNAAQKGLSKSFRDELIGYVNPYGDGNTAERIVDILKSVNWDGAELIKKEFFDVNFEV